MERMTPETSELLAKAMQLTSHQRGLLIDRLVETLDDEPADAEAEEAWAQEIKRRIDDIRSGKVKLIPGEEVLRELAQDFPDDK